MGNIIKLSKKVYHTSLKVCSILKTLGLECPYKSVTPANEADFRALEQSVAELKEASIEYYKQSGRVHKSTSRVLGIATRELKKYLG